MRRFLLPILLAVAILFFVASVLVKHHSASSYGVTISNLSDCSSHINTSSEDGLESQLYTLIRNTNTQNNTSTQNDYTATIRTGSCKTTSGKIFTSTAIFDIPLAKQSWKVTYNWLSGKELADLGQIKVACLPTNQLIYGNFNCDNIISKLGVVSSPSDPVFKHLPYSTLSYTLTAADSSGKILDAQLFLTEVDMSNRDAAIAQYKQEVIDYIKSVGLDPDNYTINYSY